MDASIHAAARALATGEPIGALQWVALRDDADGLALRGIAMAQLGELARSRVLLRRAAARFGAHETLARARCVAAEAEVTFALREPLSLSRLEAAASALEIHGDQHNAVLARLLAARHSILLGRLHEAERISRALELGRASPMLRAIGALVRSDLAIRRGRAREARAALERARAAASAAGIQALVNEVERSLARLDAPVARVVHRGVENLAGWDDVEAVLARDALVVDTCRRVVGPCSLARRPVLLGFARGLAEAWPADVARERLVERVFGQRRANDSLRARLRVEIGRLRVALRGLAEIEATDRGYRLAPRQGEVFVLLPPAEGDDAAVLALVSDGAAWSTSGLALALGVSPRTVQRILRELEAQGRVRAIGPARARRWSLAAISGHDPETGAVLERHEAPPRRLHQRTDHRRRELLRRRRELEEDPQARPPLIGSTDRASFSSRCPRVQVLACAAARLGSGKASGRRGRQTNDEGTHGRSGATAASSPARPQDPRGAHVPLALGAAGAWTASATRSTRP